MSQTEDNTHILFDSQLHTSTRKQHLKLPIDRIAHWDPINEISYFLQSTNTWTVRMISKFTAKAIQLRPISLELVDNLT